MLEGSSMWVLNLCSDKERKCTVVREKQTREQCQQSPHKTHGTQAGEIAKWLEHLLFPKSRVGLPTPMYGNSQRTSSPVQGINALFWCL